MTTLAVPSQQGDITVLVTLGVAAGTAIAQNLRYLDYLVVAAVVLAVTWFLHRKASGKLNRPATAGNDLPADERDQR